MTVVIEFTFDPNVLTALTQRGGTIDRDIERRARVVLAASVAQAPVDTGRMRGSGLAAPFEPVPAAWSVAFPVGYSFYVDQGYTRRGKKRSTAVRGRPFLSGNIDLAIN